MKALTIHQPWASLIAYGHKRYETRSWSTNYRGPIAIHAGRTGVSIEDLVDFDPQAAGMMAHALRLTSVRDLRTLPFGAVLAVGELTAVHRTEDLRVSAAEREFGNFTAGRYAWEIVDLQLLAEPIPARGAQGLWHWEPPASRQVSVKMRIEGLVVEVEGDDD